MSRKTTIMHSIVLAYILHITLTGVYSSDNVTAITLSNDTSTDIATVISNDTSTDISNDTSTNISNDTSTNISNDTSTDILNDTSTDISNDTSMDVSNDTSTDIATVISNDTSTDIFNDSLAILEGKHDSLSSCPFFTLEPGEYELFPNGTVKVETYNLTLNTSHYIFINDMVSFCVPFEGDSNVHKEYVVKTSNLTLIGLGISMISLLLHLVVFSIVPDLRNLPGWNLAALCSSLFISYLLLFVIGSGEVSDYPDACIATASLTHFFLLASILWMSVMSYDVFMALLRSTGRLRTPSVQIKWRKFGLYCLCAFGIALLFAISSLLADILDIVPEPYRPEYEELCWFSQKTPLLIFFAGPVLVLSCLNFLFFGLSAYTIHSNKMKNAQEGSESVLKRRYLMYFRLSVIMGITWIVGIVAAVANVDWLWYIFVLLNTLQGFFIFLAFTCSKKVKKYFREKLFGGRRGSEQTLSPTFQSYCFYANSIEKDLDKIVENGKDKTDTIVIHL